MLFRERSGVKRKKCKYTETAPFYILSDHRQTIVIAHIQKKNISSDHNLKLLDHIPIQYVYEIPSRCRLTFLQLLPVSKMVLTHVFSSILTHCDIIPSDVAIRSVLSSYIYFLTINRHSDWERVRG